MYRFDYLPLCTIAGSDPTGGAGIQGDLRTFAAHGAHGSAVVTALTVQGQAGIQAVSALPPAFVRDQLLCVLEESAPRALKTGMLAETGILEAVAEVLDAGPHAPLVVDPVLAAGAGGSQPGRLDVDRLTKRLAPHATLLTPNLPEAARLLEEASIRPGEEEQAARALLERGWKAVLLKGGHGEGPEVLDLLATPAGVTRFAHRRLALGPVHGTGCALAAAITAQLGRGAHLPDAVEAGLGYLQRLLRWAQEHGQWLLPHLLPSPHDQR